MKPSPENITDGFDRLPDVIILTIFNYISDIKALIRCRAVSRRFNSLAPQSDSLLLRVDRVINSVDSDSDGDTSSVIGFVKSVVKSLQNLISRPLGQTPQSQYSPATILRGFEKVKSLEIELPTGDLRLSKRANLKWKAEFGKTLKSCVILGFRNSGVSEADLGGGGGLKTRVVWTISALIAASARHYMVKEIVKEHKNLLKLIITDREDEGTVIMNELGIREFREDRFENLDEQEEQNSNDNDNCNSMWWRSDRTRVPSVWMRMRHESKLELSNGVTMDGATLVTVRPATAEDEVEDEHGWDEGLVAAGRGFDGVYGEAVAKLINCRSYLLEMNSF